MTIRTILTVPDPRLRETCKAVAEVTDDVRALLDDMLETMYDAPGIGLAAIQIGVTLRCLVMDLSPGRSDDGDDETTAEKNPIYMVNPVITHMSEELSDYEEGCLSVPDYFEVVERPARCTVSYLDYDGVAQELECEGTTATCVQHEVDHLDGGLFIDYLSRLKRERIVRKFTKALKQREQA